MRIDERSAPSKDARLLALSERAGLFSLVAHLSPWRGPNSQ